VRLNPSSTTLGRIGALELVVYENQRGAALTKTGLDRNSVKQDFSAGAPLVRLGQTGVSMAKSRDPLNPTTLNGVTSSNQRIGTTGEDTLLQPLIRQAQLKLGPAQVEPAPSESLKLADVRDSGHRLSLVEALVAELEGKASITDARSQQSISIERSLVTASPLSSAGALPLDTGQLSLMPKSGVTSMYQAIVAGKLDQPAWMEQIAGHAKMAIEKDFRVVEIRLKPAHLGTIEILMKQDADQTQLTFFSRHQAVRDALDAQMPRLEELFQEDGLTLGETSVSDRSLAEQWHGEQESETKGVSLSSLQDHEASQDVDSVADHADALDAESHRLDLWA
jgi:flagellar hook-length control protein FliK